MKIVIIVNRSFAPDPDEKLNLENMHITDWQLNPDGSELVKMSTEKPRNKETKVNNERHDEVEIKSCNSISVKIFIAGDYEIARKVCNDYCFTHGCCVNLVRNTYIYSAGEEAGVIVELINYPRFPKTSSELETISLEIASILRTNLNQDSFTIQTLKDNYANTHFYSWRHLRGK